ncbi:MAG: 5'/3'-nucleotidase SurE [Anaerovoracaceae bacterium]|jgi:5'-nucleotidase
MRILVTNDDGVDARGIEELVSALSQLAQVYVFVPDSQRSACGHGITVRAPIKVEEIQYPCATRAWTISGTPADCVKLGLRILDNEDIFVDMLFSGINHGANLGTDTFYSGTVSGAIEGVINRIPSVAVSIDSHHPSHFDAACRIAVQTLSLAVENLDEGTVLNINVPDMPWEELKGIRITRLGPREYEQWFNIEDDDNGDTHYYYAGTPVVYEGLPEDFDVMAVQRGFISITPLHLDLTSHGKMDELKTWAYVID